MSKDQTPRVLLGTIDAPLVLLVTPCLPAWHESDESQYDTPQLQDDTGPAQVEPAAEAAEEPVERSKGPGLRHSSVELPTYVRRRGCKCLSENAFELLQIPNISGHTRSPNARKNKGTAHGGKPRANDLCQSRACRTAGAALRTMEESNLVDHSRPPAGHLAMRAQSRGMIDLPYRRGLQ
jgi:hypothetical protein